MRDWRTCVVPLPLDSVHAAEPMRLRGVCADVIHRDAGNEEAGVAGPWSHRGTCKFLKPA